MGGDIGRGLGAGDFSGLVIVDCAGSDGGSTDIGGALDARSAEMGICASGNVSVSTAFALAARSVASSTGSGIEESSR